MAGIERRGFLKLLGLGAATSVLAPSVLTKALTPQPLPVPPVVPVMKAHAFIPISVEMLEDLPGLEGEFQALLNRRMQDGQRDLLALQ